MLDVSCSFVEGNGDDFLSMVIQLWKGGFVADLEGVKGVF